jgi:hypothetical protein
MVLQMTKKSSRYLAGGLAGGLLAAALLAGTTAARADIYVIESTVAAVSVGATLKSDDSLAIPANGQIRAVLPSGKTQTIRGPFNGKVSDLAKGTPNEGVWAWMVNMAKTGGSSEITTGATRSVAPAGKPRAFSWAEVPTGVNGSICVEKGAKVLLTRTAAARLDRVTLVDTASGERAEVKWEAGSQTAEWPSSLQLRADGAYQLFQQDRPKRDVTLRVVDKLPAEDDLLAELQKLGCQHQFNAWLRDKVTAGKS